MVLSESLEQAIETLLQGGVIAYPTEHCFGLGCDPTNTSAIERILHIKGRDAAQGVILLAANESQVRVYAKLDQSPLINDINRSWPGPHTWLLPVTEATSKWVSGQHTKVAVRISAHQICQQLCLKFGGAIISTSANRHGQPVLLTAQSVNDEMGNEIDFIVSAHVGTEQQPSTITDGISGERLR